MPSRRPARESLPIHFPALPGALTAGGWLLLHLRLRAQYRGENLSEAGARPIVAQVQGLQLGWDLPGFSDRVRRLRKRSALSRAQRPHAAHADHAGFRAGRLSLGTDELDAAPVELHSAARPTWHFPAAAAYALLVLTNLVYNSFGGDAGGIQFFYASPASFREIVLGKNLVHAGILLANTAFAWIAVAFFYGAPRSILQWRLWPDCSLPHRELHRRKSALDLRAAETGFLHLRPSECLADHGAGQPGVQIVIVGVGVAVFLIAHLYKNLWIATLAFLVLAAISIPIYADGPAPTRWYRLAAAGNAGG